MLQPKNLIYVGIYVEFTLKDGRLTQEVEYFFLCLLIKQIHEWYCTRDLNIEPVHLPSPVELKSAYQYEEISGPEVNLFFELPFHNRVQPVVEESKGPKIVFLSTRNMR